MHVIEAALALIGPDIFVINTSYYVSALGNSICPTCFAYTTKLYIYIYIIDLNWHDPNILHVCMYPCTTYLIIAIFSVI